MNELEYKIILKIKESVEYGDCDKAEQFINLLIGGNQNEQI